jgi:16S rRNA (guanine966-N2)-methyltransferase
VRIVAGRFRRRKLLTNPGTTTRPITDRVKEILFERLSADLEEARVADVFAGTGTLGLEALSRGAKSVVFIENDHSAHELLLANVQKLGAQSETLCWRADVMRCSFRPKGVPAFLPYDVIFFDPPYRLVPYIQPGDSLYKSLERLARSDVSSSEALLVFRTPEDAEFTLPPEWLIENTLDISSMNIHLARKSQTDTAEPQPDPASVGR